jgi:integrase/recombinase XerD
LSYHQEQNHAESTVRFYRKELQLFLSFLGTEGHSMRVGDLSAWDVRRYIKHLLDAGRSPRTRRTRLQAIKTFLEWCTDWEYLQQNPATRIKLPRSEPAAKPLPSSEDFLALLDFCPLDCLVNARRAAMLWLLASTGMRRQELYELQLVDLSFGEYGFIEIRKGKAGKYRISAFLDSEEAPVQQAMEAYLSYRRDDLPWLWVTAYGRRLSYDGIGQDQERLAELAGVRDRLVDICHGWRRYCAVQAAEQDLDPSHVLTNLGWSSYAMFNHYTRSRLLERRRAVQAFQKFNPAQGR